MPLTTDRPAPRRQARGQRRIEQILDAAGLVFADVGYAAATTNAIAARAGISPGSLYQFFPNKTAIAVALEERYAARIREAHDAAIRPRDGETVDEAVDRLVDSVLAFAVGTPGFTALFAGRAMPAHVASSTHDLHAAMVARVGAILDLSGQRMDAGTRHRRTLIATQLCRAMTPMIAAAEEPERGLLADELRRVLRAYLGSTAA